MRVGFLGLGRLGLPIAAVLSQHHEVTGYDPDPTIEKRLTEGHPWEKNLTEYLGKITLAEPEKIARSDIVIVAVQTPHSPELDGTHPDTGLREPFDTTYLEAALKTVGHGPPVVVMSTVLPGTSRRLSPLVSELIYSPAFIAMGATIEDLLNPEFVLVGENQDSSHLIGDLLGPVYLKALDTPVIHCSWETAELAKMAYNTAIGAKLALANTVAWLADETDADGAAVMEILSRADKRITSPAYLQPGLGDGGQCHPRDQIALSWLARQHGVYDWFTAIIEQRERHSEWIATIAELQSLRHDLPVVILGGAYKPNTTLTDGSPALLLANQTGWPIVNIPPEEPAIIVIGVAHDHYRKINFPKDSIVIDPWGIIEWEGRVVRPGRQ